MDHKIIFLAFLSLLWTCTSEAEEAKGPNINVRMISGKIEVSCGDEYKINPHKDQNLNSSVRLAYEDENSGEYTCEKDGDSNSKTTIFVKLRTCDNCIELDPGSIAGIVIGEIVATVVLGVAVYIVASQAQSGSVTSNKKSSDRQRLVPNEVSHRPNNDHYQPLRFQGGQKDTYDIVSKK